MNKIKVIDSIMGSGKSTYAMNLMNEDTSNRYIYITPFITECDRIVESSNRMFQPDQIDGLKLKGLKQLLREGKSIATTHSLFTLFDEDVKELVEQGNYICIIDEVVDVVHKHKFRTSGDKYSFFKFFAYVEEETGLVRWNEDNIPSEEYGEGSKFYDMLTMCKNENLIQVNKTTLCWQLPVNLLSYFKDTYIMTFMFKGSFHKAYLDSHGMEYEYFSLEEGKLCEYKGVDKGVLEELQGLINLEERDIYNDIGKRVNGLTSGWYDKNLISKAKGGGTILGEKLQRNIQNYFKNVVKGKMEENLWTCFKKGISPLKGVAYTRDHIPYNERATNKWREKKNLVYPVNVYPHPSVVQYMSKYGVQLDQEAYALAILIQWIWRSRIRNQDRPLEERTINLYLPSSRMRGILKKFLAGEL